MRTYLLILLSVFFIACNSEQKEKAPENDNPNVEIVDDTPDVETVEAPEGGKVIQLNDASFRQLVHDYKANPKWQYKGELPCIVDFYADWCRPCREIAPILDELAKEYEGRIYIYKVNTDFEGELTNFYGVQYLPTLLLCKTTGDPVKQVGAYSKSDFVNWIENDLLK